MYIRESDNSRRAQPMSDALVLSDSVCMRLWLVGKAREALETAT